jgi:hypothetical protein
MDVDSIDRRREADHSVKFGESRKLHLDDQVLRQVKEFSTWNSELAARPG